MTINDVPEVVVDPIGGRKFIVAKLFDSNGGEKLVVRANEKCDFHIDILERLADEVRPIDLKARCIGGGWIKVNPDEKTICISRKSGDFGKEPDRQQTVRMLQTAFPEFQVIAD